ncbi:MAG: SDR family oxidoreductase [Deltaproteobacteria bacterium]|nr:SDR family oxidoreductase [Deltaproteobacteria bacterium]
MKVIIIGASGQVGGAIMRLAPKDWETTGTYSGKPKPGLIHLDVSNRKEVFEVFEKVRPDVAILSAAFTNVDLCETDKERADAVNVSGPLNICDASVKHGSKMVYMSTDYVFDGENGPYREDDAPNPLGYYAWTKLEGERITAFTPNHLIIRTTGVYSADPDSLNFVMQVIKRLGAGESMRVPSDQYGTPTLADNLAEGILTLLTLGKTGIFNVAGSDFMDRYSFSLLIADIFGLDKTLITQIDTPSLGQKARRPLRAGLIVEKIEKEAGIKMVGAREGLMFVKERLNASR